MSTSSNQPEQSARRKRRRRPTSRSTRTDRPDPAVIERRRALVPTISYPPQLPVSEARNAIAEAISEHQVVVVAGETGSGKTTQLPKICLELGRGLAGKIGHTQPRRLAARSVAERIAEETGTELGGVIGYSVRFTDKAGDDTLVKVMTDGILLRELSQDRMLREYDTLIIDEAHERSLNIDFILGYLKQLLPRRPDLKIIITSATIEPGRFADHFATDDAPVPIIEVSGRTYPVEIRYRPLVVDDEDEADLDQLQAIGAAVDELCSHGPGDILVFLPTEREITDTAKSLAHLESRGIEIVPLFARLSAADQHKVFSSHRGRRIVLSTNVAETSLTVPGIHYVIDAGTARMSRYSTRTKVQRLPIEPISQASARQRAGRCGRVAAGVCIRLYSEEDFESRPEYTEPEILRTNLASVILTMTSLGLGDVGRFPFVQPPDQRAIRDGQQLLDELGALEPASADNPVRRLTPIGRSLARIPVDPRLARMLVEADKQGVVGPMLVLAAALSIPDVRERPAEHRQAADASHARFAAPGSEFLTLLNLWTYLDELRSELSSNQFRKRCGREYLHSLRIREWRDLHAQLVRIAKDLGWSVPATVTAPDHESPSAASIHQSILSGLLSQIGVREGDAKEFLGARGTKFMIFPGSHLSSKPPRFVMAAEIVETSRLWARTAARIEPEWAERLAGHLVKRQYSEPHWSGKHSAAMAYERVTLYGVPLVTKRRVNYGSIDPAVARELFIRHALVEGDWRTQHPFFHRNRALLEDAEESVHRVRRTDVIVDDDQLFAFYDRHIGGEVVSGRHFDTWWKTARKADPTLLDLDPADLVADTAATDPAGFPDHWRQGDTSYALRYRFEPGTVDDGVSVLIPLSLLVRARPSGFDWLVPGMRLELITELIRTLPKSLRRQVGPAPDLAARILESVTPRSKPLTEAVAAEIRVRTGVDVAASDLRLAALPDHLRMTFTAVTTDGEVLGRSKSLRELQDRLAGRSRAALESEAGTASRPVATTWTADTFGDISRTLRSSVAGQDITSYPALTRRGSGFTVVAVPTQAEQAANMYDAVVEMIVSSVPPLRPSVTSTLSTAERLALSQSPYPDTAALLADCVRAAVVDLVPNPPNVWTPSEFAALRENVARQATGRATDKLRRVATILTRVAPLRTAITAAGRSIAADDVRDQLDELLFDGFVSATRDEHLAEIPRYLDAARSRLEQLPAGAARDVQAMAAIDRVVSAWTDHLRHVPPGRRDAVNEQAGWIVEELRVGLFAQHLRTAYPVSEKRAIKAIRELR
ncbi:ATP-dependent RNA helicase HrpA [Williamsia muralis]|uniref:ATP-dependent RNA helicase HrpA n=1 Tax=Williamsia marianensis TaxID=85044 RepID=UPI000E32A098|nr:ATP-dependent RNA helicase HrpA [Williamsia marianensis]